MFGGCRVMGLPGNAPIAVQSMTNTDTADVAATVKQVRELAQAGSELVRLTINTDEAARAVVMIAEQLQQADIDVPLIGDFHFNGHILLPGNPGCAEALDKYRINPGNVGTKHRDANFTEIVRVAILDDPFAAYDCSFSRLLSRTAGCGQKKSEYDLVLYTTGSRSIDRCLEKAGPGANRIC